MEAKVSSKHTQGIACPHCNSLNNATSMFEQETEKGYYIKTAASTVACRVCSKSFNYELELKVDRV